MKLFRSIIAICMALLIMVVTTGFSISQHFCQGELLAFALFGKAEPCEMAMTQNDLPPCHNQDNTDRSDSSFAKKPCCENHDAAVAGQDTPTRSEEHTSELQSLMRNSYAV